MAAITLIIEKYLEEVEAPQRVIPAFYDPQWRRASKLVFVLEW